MIIFRGERIDDLRLYVSFLPDEFVSDFDSWGSWSRHLFNLQPPAYHRLSVAWDSDPSPVSSRFFRELTLHEMAHALGMVPTLVG